MKLAVVHDYLNQYGGAERVVETLHELYPSAPVFTSIFLPDNLPSSFESYDIRTSFMQKLPFLNKHFKKYLPLYQNAIETFDLSGFDVILSSSSAFAKGVKVPDRVCHICYCYSPMRFVWEYDSYIKHENISNLYRLFLPFVIGRLRRWDLDTVDRVHSYIAISNYVKEKIASCYGRQASVIYPPVNVSRFQVNSKRDNFYLVVSRLNAYKRIDLVLDVFKKLGLPLFVAGSGPMEESLKATASNNIKFLGKVSDQMLTDLYRKCRAFIFPGKEDFGIAPVEAMASGSPVIAFGAGGALETIVDGVTGLYFHEQSPESLFSAVRKFELISWDPLLIRKHAEQFDKDIFKDKMRVFIQEKVRVFQNSKVPLTSA